MVGGRRPLRPEICAQNDPPSENRRPRPISAYNVLTVRASEKDSIIANKKSRRAFQRAIDEVRTLSLSPPKGWLKNSIVVFANKNQINSTKLCYKVSLCKNFQRKSCSRTIPLSISNAVYMLAVNVTLERNI